MDSSINKVTSLWKRVLVQLDGVLASIIHPLAASSSIEIVDKRPEPVVDYPSPWPFIKDIIRPRLGFQSFRCARILLAGIDPWK